MYKAKMDTNMLIKNIERVINSGYSAEDLTRYLSRGVDEFTREVFKGIKITSYEVEDEDKLNPEIERIENLQKEVMEVMRKCNDIASMHGKLIGEHTNRINALEDKVSQLYKLNLDIKIDEEYLNNSKNKVSSKEHKIQVGNLAQVVVEKLENEEKDISELLKKDGTYISFKDYPRNRFTWWYLNQIGLATIKKEFDVEDNSTIDLYYRTEDNKEKIIAITLKELGLE